MIFLRGIRTITPSAVFVGLGLVFGSLLAISTPPFQAPDELAHLMRIWQLSKGHIVATNYGGNVPTSFLECFGPFRSLPGNPAIKINVRTIVGEFGRPLGESREVYVTFANTAIYSPLPYVAQTLGVLVGRCLDGPPVLLLYLGRLFNLALYIFLGSYAIRMTPLLKWPTAILLLNPVSLFLAASLSADPTTMGLIFLATAMVFRFSTMPELVGWVDKATLTIAMAAAPILKWGYFPIVGMLAAIPRANLREHRHGNSLLLAIPAVAAAGMVIWTLASHPSAARLRIEDPVPQVHWIIRHPIGYFSVLARTFRDTWLTLCVTLVGDLGWLDTVLSPINDVFYVALLGWLVLNDGPAALSFRTRVIALVAVITSILLIVTFEYVAWTPVGARTVEGIQGRYFLPLSMLLCGTVRGTGRYPAPPRVIAGFLTISLTYVVYAIAHRYYF